MFGTADVPTGVALTPALPTLPSARAALAPFRTLNAARGVKRGGDTIIEGFSVRDTNTARPKAALPRSKGQALGDAQNICRSGLSTSDGMEGVASMQGDQKRVRREEDGGDVCEDDESMSGSEESFVSDDSMDVDSYTDIEPYPPALPVPGEYATPPRLDPSQYPKLSAAWVALHTPKPAPHIRPSDQHIHEAHNHASPKPSAAPSGSRLLLPRISALSAPPRAPYDPFGRRMTAVDGEELSEERVKMLGAYSAFAVGGHGHKARRGISGLVMGASGSGGGSGLKNAQGVHGHQVRQDKGVEGRWM